MKFYKAQKYSQIEIVEPTKVSEHYIWFGDLMVQKKGKDCFYFETLEEAKNHLNWAYELELQYHESYIIKLNKLKKELGNGKNRKKQNKC